MMQVVAHWKETAFLGSFSPGILNIQLAMSDLPQSHVSSRDLVRRESNLFQS